MTPLKLENPSCPPDRSDGPLSLNELIRFIDAISCQELIESE
jgi:hypothetical protein